jgi:hypothetical protein
MMIFNYRIAGIPCKISVISVDFHKGEGYWAPSSEDAKDWITAEYEVLDRKGYPAEWLAKKVTDKINSDIITAISERA